MHFANPFSSPGIWYKGNLHTHTTQSDGGLAPEEAADLYRKAGYDFLPPDSCRAAVIVRAPELTREALLTSLRQGLFYASEGPTIHEVTISDGTVQARTSPVKEINFVAQRWLGGHVEAGSSEFLTEAAHQLRGQEDYLRVECRDAEGRWAWANPIFLGD